jgi:EPS-associated MarR family transcriptional regulator
MISEVHYKLMRLLEERPELSQREIARLMNISVGKVNYCLQALVENGWVKVVPPVNRDGRLLHSYVITPRGSRRKAALAAEFLRIKTRQYELLRAEIRQIRKEVSAMGFDSAGAAGLVSTTKRT